MALAPHFQGPRPKDRGSVGSALVCRWPPGGVSGALRPPQSPQDSGETSLTSLWQPHRKVKQRGGKVRVSGLLLGGHVRRWPQNPPTHPFVSFPVFPLTRVADSVCTWWDHALEGSRSSWPTTRALTPELANSRHTLVQSVYRQGRCLRRAHCGLLRAGTDAGPNVCPRASGLLRCVRGCVHSRDLHSVALSCSSRSLSAVSSIWSILPATIKCYSQLWQCRAGPCHRNALLQRSHMPVIVQGRCANVFAHAETGRLQHTSRVLFCVPR